MDSVFPINQFLQIVDSNQEILHPGEHHWKLGDHHLLNRKVDLYHCCSMTHLQEIHLHLHYNNHFHTVAQKSVGACQPGPGNLTQQPCCFLGRRINCHMALPANHQYLLVLLSLFCLFHLYNHCLFLLHPAARPHLPGAGLGIYLAYLPLLHHLNHQCAAPYHHPIVCGPFCLFFSLPFVPCHFTHLACF